MLMNVHCLAWLTHIFVLYYICVWKNVYPSTSYFIIPGSSVLSVSFLSKNILLAKSFRCRSLAGPEMTGLFNIDSKVILMI